MSSAVAGHDQAAPPPLHKLESRVMDEVWRQKAPTTVRSIVEALRRARTERAYSTIKTTMIRLDRKGLLIRDRRGKKNVYRSVMSKEDYLDARARAEAGAMVDAYGDFALTHFARHICELDPRHREQLRRRACVGSAREGTG